MLFLWLLLAPAFRLGAGEVAFPQVGVVDRPESALFDEARRAWERNLPGDGLAGGGNPPAQARRHILRFEEAPPVHFSATLHHFGIPGGKGPFTLPSTPDPFDPLAPPPAGPVLVKTAVLDVPAAQFFRTGNHAGLPRPTPVVPGTGGWIAVEAHSEDLGLETLRSLRQIGFASITPIPEPGLLSLAGLTLTGALFRRRRPVRS